MEDTGASGPPPSFWRLSPCACCGRTSQDGGGSRHHLRGRCVTYAWDRDADAAAGDLSRDLHLSRPAAQLRRANPSASSRCEAPVPSGLASKSPWEPSVPRGDQRQSSHVLFGTSGVSTSDTRSPLQFTACWSQDLFKKTGRWSLLAPARLRSPVQRRSGPTQRQSWQWNDVSRYGHLTVCTCRSWRRYAHGVGTAYTPCSLVLTPLPSRGDSCGALPLHEVICVRKSDYGVSDVIMILVMLSTKIREAYLCSAVLREGQTRVFKSFDSPGMILLVFSRPCGLHTALRHPNFRGCRGRAGVHRLDGPVTLQCELLHYHENAYRLQHLSRPQISAFPTIWRGVRSQFMYASWRQSEFAINESRARFSTSGRRPDDWRIRWLGRAVPLLIFTLTRWGSTPHCGSLFGGRDLRISSRNYAYFVISVLSTFGSLPHFWCVRSKRRGHCQCALRSIITCWRHLVPPIGRSSGVEVKWLHVKLVN